MATPRGESYSAASGAVVYGGRLPPPTDAPAWVSSAVAGRWGIVPVAAALSTLDPKLNPAINPNYPGVPEWYGWTGFHSIVTTWCGGCYNPDGDELWLPLGGGHADYGGNEPYKLSLNKATPNWTMLRPPSGAIGNLLTTNDGQEASGVYADGQPRSIHSANKPVWVPSLGMPYISAQGGTYMSGQAGRRGAIAIDPVTGIGTMKAVNTGTAPMTASCFDPTRGTKGSIWARSGGGSSHRIQRYDVATDTWTLDIGSNATFENYLSLTYMPEHDCILAMDGVKFMVFDCVTGLYSTPTVTGTGYAEKSACQPAWANGKAYVWNNSSNTDKVTRYTPPANPRTGTWTVDALSVDAGNTITPDVKTVNGTFGRFAYSPKMGVFIVMNTINGNIYFFKPSAL